MSKLTEEENALVGLVTALRLKGAGEPKISQELSITRHKVRKIIASDEYKNFLKEMGEKACNEASASFRNRMVELEPLAYAALRENLKNKKLDAVRLWAEVSGAKVGKDNQGDDSPGVINIVLPGEQPKEKDVSEKVIEVSSGQEET